MKLNKISHLTGHRGAIYDLALWRDKVLSVGGDGWIVAWEADGQSEDGKLLAQVEAKVFCLAVKDEDTIWLGDMNGHLFCVDLEKRETLRNIEAHQKGLFSIYPFGKHLFTLGGDGVLHKWDLDSLRIVESYQLSHEALRCIKPVSDHIVLIGSSDNSIYVFDIEKMVLLRKMEAAHQNSVFSIESINDVIVSGGRDARLNTWTYPNFELKKSQEAHWYTINDLLYIESFDALITASRDKSIRLWDAVSLQPIQTIGLQQGGHMNSVNTLLFDKTHQYLYSAGDDRSIIRYTIE